MSMSKPVSEMSEAELREALLQYRLADGSAFDAEGAPIRARAAHAFVRQR